jgi:hypothetical protein
VIVDAALEPPAVVSGLDDVTVMGQPVEQCGASPNTLGQSPNARLVVTMMEERS